MSFFSLPRQHQRRIDKAFNASASQSSNQNDDDIGGGGGFIVERPSRPKPSSIRLSDIPSALLRLELPPDDQQVLAVFRNAASGWSSSSLDPSEEKGDGGEDDEYVSRDDWRAVCAVLLEHRPIGPNDDSGDSDSGGDGEYGDNDGENGDEIREEDSGDSDDFQAPSSGEEEEGDDDDSDEYVQGGPSSTRRQRSTRTSLPPVKSAKSTRGTKRRRRSTSHSSDDGDATRPGRASTKRLTPKQRQTCLDAFALFFPSTPPAELEAQKIMIKDVQRVSNLLNEKLKAEEIIEMLETFSSSNDKIMSFEDFGRMMLAAKLV